MVDFSLSTEQQMMVDTARKLIKREVIEPHVDMQLDRSSEFPHAIFKILWENGLLNLELPTHIGGPGLGCVEDVLVQEEINYGCLGIGSTVNADSLAIMPLIIANNERLLKKYAGRMVEEPLHAAYACSEPDAGSDVAAMTTKFTQKGNTYILNGQKRWITNGDVANWYVVFAREEGSKGHKGIAAFIVDAGTSGVRWDALVHKMGQRTSHTCDVLFDDAVIPAENLLAGPEQGFKLAMATFDRSRPWIAAAAAGVIRRAKDESVQYACDRKTFGTPIANHQMIQSMLADMEISYQATHLLALNAAYAVDRGEIRGTHSACAKAFGADSAMQVTSDAVQILGGYGYTNEFVVEKLMRDAKLLQIFEGTSQIQRMVIARDMVRQIQGR